MQFNADVADGLPWKFTPCQREVLFNPCHSIVKAFHLQSKFNFGLFFAGYGKYPSPQNYYWGKYPVSDSVKE